MTKNAPKPWWQSLTIWMGILQMISGSGLVAGLNIEIQDNGDFAFTGNFYTLWASIGPIITGTGTIYGKVRAAAAPITPRLRG